MHILHYSLGLPPYRSGGLTKYATDLMVAQQANNDIVTLLYPGDYTFWKVPAKRIVQQGELNKITVFEILNPCPVPLLHGLKEPLSIVNESYKLSHEDLERFYDMVRPEVMHIHTLMGLPPELLDFIKGKGVKIIYTSHDYYGLCLKVNFINQAGEFCYKPGAVACELCNRDSSGSLFLRLRNSSYLLKFKDRFSIRFIHLKEKKELNKNDSYPDTERTSNYASILDYYQKMFKQIDCFHFNSTISKETYEKFLTPKHSSVINISHAGIRDCRKVKKFESNLIRLAFIGNTTDYKGFQMLKEVLCKLTDKGVTNWSLQVWGGKVGIDPDNAGIIYSGKYSSEKLETVFDGIDLLIVPSIWKETFSLISLEAIANGTPCLVSENVGAKDIIKSYGNEFIFHPSVEALYIKLEIILSNISILKAFNMKVCSKGFEYFFEDHVRKINQLYLNTLKS